MVVRFYKTASLGALGLAAVVLSGCTYPSDAIGFFGPLNVATTVATEKTLWDHAVSLASGKNCSTVRAENDQTYCVEDEPPIASPTASYCYRSLGDVTCYRHIDPYGRGQDTVTGNVPAG